MFAFWLKVLKICYSPYKLREKWILLFVCVFPNIMLICRQFHSFMNYSLFKKKKKLKKCLGIIIFIECQQFALQVTVYTMLYPRYIISQKVLDVLVTPRKVVIRKWINLFCRFSTEPSRRSSTWMNIWAYSLDGAISTEGRILV